MRDMQDNSRRLESFVQLHVWVSAADKALLDGASADRDQTVSAVVRMLIRRYRQELTAPRARRDAS